MFAQCINHDMFMLLLQFHIHNDKMETPLNPGTSSKPGLSGLLTWLAPRTVKAFCPLVCPW